MCNLLRSKPHTSLTLLFLRYLLLNILCNSLLTYGDELSQTVEVVNIQDDAKTQYHNQNFKSGEYNYGYDIKPEGPLGQFHHEIKGDDEVVYGCYGYLDPDDKPQITYYISDTWGYRPVVVGSPTKLFLPKDHPEGYTEKKATEVNWPQLTFPELCKNYEGQTLESYKDPKRNFINSPLSPPKGIYKIKSSGNKPESNGQYRPNNENVGKLKVAPNLPQRAPSAVPATIPSKLPTKFIGSLTNDEPENGVELISSSLPIAPNSQNPSSLTNPNLPIANDRNNNYNNNVNNNNYYKRPAPTSSPTSFTGSSNENNLPNNPNTYQKTYQTIKPNAFSSNRPVTPSLLNNTPAPTPQQRYPQNVENGNIDRNIKNQNGRLASQNPDEFISQTTPYPTSPPSFEQETNNGYLPKPAPGFQYNKNSPENLGKVNDNDEGLELPLINNPDEIKYTQPAIPVTSFPQQNYNRNNLPNPQNPKYSGGGTYNPSINSNPAIFLEENEGNQFLNPDTKRGQGNGAIKPNTDGKIIYINQDSFSNVDTPVRSPLNSRITPSRGGEKKPNNGNNEPRDYQPSSYNPSGKTKAVNENDNIRNLPAGRYNGPKSTSSFPSQNITFSPFIPQQNLNINPSTDSRPPFIIPPNQNLPQSGDGILLYNLENEDNDNINKNPSTCTSCSQKNNKNNPNNRNAQLNQNQNPIRIPIDQNPLKNQNDSQYPKPGTKFDDFDFSTLPGAVVSNVPVIFYPDCSENAFSRPAIVPYCPAAKSSNECANVLNNEGLENRGRGGRRYVKRSKISQ